MHKNKKNKKNLSYYAKIFLAISIALFLYGLLSTFFNSISLNKTIKFIETEDDESVISITTIDGSQIVPGNTVKEKPSEQKPAQNPSQPQNTPQNIPSSNGGGGNNNQPAPAPSPEVQTLDEQNNNLRKSIQSSFNLTIRYGGETSGYTVAGLSTEPISNATTINSQLNRLKEALQRYPQGLFKEIRDGGIPLTIFLISQYSEPSVTGVTDSSYSYANISIAAVHPFEDSFYHESYHYIERYMLKKGMNFNNWDSLNPRSFQGWGVIDGNLSYDVTFSPDAPFVNNYAQTAAAEDRASTFEYMMADTKASCLNNGTYVWKKADRIALSIESALGSVSPNSIEYWERYIR